MSAAALRRFYASISLELHGGKPLRCDVPNVATTEGWRARRGGQLWIPQQTLSPEPRTLEPETPLRLLLLPPLASLVTLAVRADARDVISIYLEPETL